MPILTAEELRRYSEAVLLGTGATDDDARVVATSLVRSNLAGHDSHGVIRLPQYCRMLRAGQIVTGAPVEVVRETATTACVDGHWGFGQVVARFAAELARRKASEAGVAAVTVRNSNHVGRLGEYVELLADGGAVGIAALNNHGAGRYVAPWGGTRGKLSTNPLAIAVPGPEYPLVLDITTCTVAEGKVRVRRNSGQPVPEGWIIDSEGRPTTDPNDLYSDPPGAILPLGGLVGHKGFGLSFMVDILAGALGGAGCSREVDPQFGNGLLFLALDVDSVSDAEAFQAHVAGLVAHVKDTPPAPGFQEVLAPGEIERRHEQQRSRHGIPVDDETWRQILEAAELAGVPAPEAMS